MGTMDRPARIARTGPGAILHDISRHIETAATDLRVELDTADDCSVSDKVMDVAVIYEGDKINLVPPSIIPAQTA